MFDSWLWERYNHPVCDGCRDDLGEHKLIPRTEAKSTYLLKDCDLDLRNPPLRFWAKKNPHNPRYGDMKLYLKCQVVERMLEIYGVGKSLKRKSGCGLPRKKFERRRTSRRK
ncbi:DNA repair protein [Ancylostoma duodenale]|uniref:DNA repair protein n=1 Tax=Ancylostoma duodenale TaxID=51022 RepID=A0A0C2G780_9BILA|nr:DNA repair protein [Ancylostoma duodenale]